MKIWAPTIAATLDGAGAMWIVSLWRSVRVIVPRYSGLSSVMLNRPLAKRVPPTKDIATGTPVFLADKAEPAREMNLARGTFDRRVARP